MLEGTSTGIAGLGVMDTAADWLQEVLPGFNGEAVFVSPYLTYDVCREIAKASRSSTGPWKLITSLNPSAVANGYLSVEGLRLLLMEGAEIAHVERLHAKCFLAGHRGMLGSANLTGAGLGTSARPNRELGVELDAEQVSQVWQIISGWPVSPVDDRVLDELLSKARTLTQTHSEQYDDLSPQTALQLAEKLLDDAREQDRSLWVKLEYGAPGLESWREESFFASPKKGKPGFKPGDLVFICAKDTQDCYAVVEVTAQPEYQPHDYLDVAATWGHAAADRWPWINRTKPRFVPASLMQLKLSELGVSTRGLQNGHVRVKFDQFTAGVRALARLASAE